MPESATLRLAATMHAETAHVERALADVQEATARLHAAPDDRMIIESASVRLHAFYSGIERCLTTITRHYGEQMESDGWHAQLLNRMTQNVPGIRSAILTPESVTLLNRLRSFRHRFRNLYSFQLDGAQVIPLLTEATLTWARVSVELRVFMDNLVPPPGDSSG